MSSFWTYFAYVFAAYVVISYILFKFPNILHKRKTYKSKLLQDILDRKGVLHVSHRGGAREHLENTMAAFKHAVIDLSSHFLAYSFDQIAVGTNSLEMDVMRTKDGQIVVCHDPTLDRLCGVHRYIWEYDYADIPPFQTQVPLHFAINQTYDSTKEAEHDRRMPLLREVFEAFPYAILNIEIKTPTSEAIISVNLLIKEFQREHITFWGCREKKATEQLLRINPNALTFFSMGRVMITYLAYFLGFLPFIPIRENSMQVPMLTRELEEMARHEAKFAAKLMFWVVNLFFKVSGPLIQHLGKRGIFVIFWVLNNEEDWRRAVQKGTHGIMTDIPTDLARYLKEENLYINATR